MVVIWWIASYSIKHIPQTTSEKAVENWSIEEPWMVWIAKYTRERKKYKYIIIFKTKMFWAGRKKRKGSKCKGNFKILKKYQHDFGNSCFFILKYWAQIEYF